MAKYRVLEASFIDNKMCKEGDVVEYDGIPGSNLEPLDAPAEKAAKKVDPAGDKKRLEAAAQTGSPDAGGGTEALA